MSITTNQPAIVDEGTFSIRRSIRIAASQPKVWEAVTAPEHISRWFGQTEFGGRGAGATGTMSWPGRQPIPLLIEAIEPQRMVAYRWNNDDASGVVPEVFDGQSSTRFTFTLEPVDGGTQLTVEETGFEVTSDAVENLYRHQQGWTSELDTLVALLEARP